MPTGMQFTRFVPEGTDLDDPASVAVANAGDLATAKSISARLSAVGVVPANRLRITCRAGTVTVSGLLDWQFQRQAVLDQIRRHPGTHHVIDEIEVRPLLDAALLMQRIDSATSTRAPGEIAVIAIDIDGARVTLRGRVASEALRSLAETTAWATPGVALVENRITVA